MWIGRGSPVRQWPPLQLLMCLSLLSVPGEGWHQTPAKLAIDYVYGPLSDTVKRFLGNHTGLDNFKIVVQDGPALFVGGTNTVYILSSKDLKEHKNLRINWEPDPGDFEMCTVKGKSKALCQNYIRVIAKTDKNRILICGTQAFKPKCRYYKYKDGSYTTEVEQEFDGKLLTPYDPSHNSSYLLADGELYAATVSDFSGSDPVIYRDPLRTEQYDSKVLNAPDFVRTLEDEDYVYFFYREQAVEYINCGKSVYSRVARVCKNDSGGPNKFKNRWTTYLKSRLNCSIPGDYPFYFNHLQSVSNIMSGNYPTGDKMEATRLVYAVFTTPENAIGGNAICAFRMADILETFQGAFKEQETANSNWLPVRDNKVPDPRPGVCTQDSQKVPESSLRFIQDHSIMDEPVPAFFGGKPVYIRANIVESSQFREIVVDPQVETTDGHKYDVMFVGTDKGQVLKIVHPLSLPEGKPDPQRPAGRPGEAMDGPVLVEDLRVTSLDQPILNLQLVGRELLVVTKEELVLVPLQRCSLAITCSACVRLQDPYCGWNVIRSRCVAAPGALEPDNGSPSSQQQRLHHSEFLQNVTHGRHRLCGDSDSSPVIIEQFTDTVGNDGIGSGAGGRSAEEMTGGERSRDYVSRVEYPGLMLGGAGSLNEGRYSTEELSMAVATSCVAALVLGFIAGFLVARKCRCESNNPYHVPYLNRSGYEEENIYAKVDEMTYYPVVPTPPGLLAAAQGDTQSIRKHNNIINNLLVTDQLESKTLNLHQANTLNKKDFNTFNAFSTAHRSQKIYL